MNFAKRIALSVRKLNIIEEYCGKMIDFDMSRDEIAWGRALHHSSYQILYLPV